MYEKTLATGPRGPITDEDVVLGSPRTKNAMEEDRVTIHVHWFVFCSMVRNPKSRGVEGWWLDANLQSGLGGFEGVGKLLKIVKIFLCHDDVEHTSSSRV